MGGALRRPRPALEPVRIRFATGQDATPKRAHRAAERAAAASKRGLDREDCGRAGTVTAVPARTPPVRRGATPAMRRVPQRPTQSSQRPQERPTVHESRPELATVQEVLRSRIPRPPLQ